MSEPADRPRNNQPQPDLRAALREVKNAMADREDVVVDLGDAERMRLEILLQELEPLIKQVPAEDERFDFTISAGTRPRLWIDPVAHVSMGRDRRTYRFVADSRLGRVVLAENPDLRTVSQQIARYIAERILERERSLDHPGRAAGATLRVQTPGQARFSRIMEATAFSLLGAAAGAAILLVLAWDRIFQ